jgi:hypothetical protein
MRPREDWALAVALAAGALFSFAELVPSGLRTAAIAPFLALSCGAVVLALAGWAVAGVCALRVAEGNFALHIGIGQAVLLTWLYLRSGLSALATQAAGIALPVTRAEILLLVASLLWLARGKAGMPALRPLLPAAGWVAVAIFLIAQRELPRETMISTDPTLHLFLGSQVMRLGVIPFSLGMWGPGDFAYPAGYGALCAVWSWVSGASAQNVVASGPLLQSLLSLMAVASLAARWVAGHDNRLQLVTGFVALLLFFGFFPFSLTKPFYLLEKTGSISCLLLLLTTLCMTVYGAYGPQTRDRFAAFLLAGAGVGLSALVNPLAAVVPGTIYGGALCKRLWEKRTDLGAAAGLAILHGAAPLLLVFTEPYYIRRLLWPRPPAPSASTETAAGPTGDAAGPAAHLLADAGRYAVDFLTTLQWVKPFLQTPYFGRTAMSAVPLLVAMAIIWRLSPADKRKPAMRLLALAPVPILVLEFTLLPIGHALRFRGDLYLFAPYLLDSMVRFGYLWYTAIVILALAMLFERASRLNRGLALCALVATLAMIPVRIARDHLANEVRMAPRYDRCFYLGCVTADDRVVLQALAERFASYSAAGGSLQFAAVPKILLPNSLEIVHALWQQYGDAFIERWLKPTGASIAVPFIPTFPAAFFFTKGSGDYSNENYEARVCRKLDIAWLRERNIRYMFVPVHRKRVCVAGLDDLLRNGKVIARSGEAYLIELF